MLYGDVWCMGCMGLYALYGVRIKVSEYARGAGTDLPRRRLTPAPCWVHPRDMCACTRPAAGWIAQRARSVPAPPVVRRSTAAPNNVRKTRSSSDDLLLLLGRQLLAVRSIVSRSVMVGSASVMEFCGCNHTAVRVLWHSSRAKVRHAPPMSE